MIVILEFLKISPGLQFVLYSLLILYHSTVFILLMLHSYTCTRKSLFIICTTKLNFLISIYLSILFSTLFNLGASLYILHELSIFGFLDYYFCSKTKLFNISSPVNTEVLSSAVVVKTLVQ